MIHKAQKRLDLVSAPAPGKVRRTPQGGILADCTPTRCGVLSYTYPDGRTVRELRHPDEVFRSDSLESLAGAPVTCGHPAVPVTADNWATYAKGQMGDDVKRDGLFVAAKARVHDAGTVKGVEDGLLVEMSCGYEADVDESPGEYNGERYDAIQRNIRYNHVALGPKNWGRAGPDVGLKLDSPYSEGMGLIHLDEGDKPADKKPETVVFKADEFVSRADHDALRGENAALKADCTKKDAEIATLKAATSPAALDAAVATRQSLVDAARKIVGPSFKADGKSAHEIRSEAVKTARPELKLDGESEDFVKGIFATLSTAAVAAAKSADTAADVTNGQRQDAATDEDPIEAARKRRDKHNASLFQKVS